MSTTLEALEAEVMRLSPQERSLLLDRIAASLDTADALDAAWDREAARRDAEIENGTSIEVPGRFVLARLRAQVR
jgi:Putative addiction module component